MVHLSKHNMISSTGAPDPLFWPSTYFIFVLFCLLIIFITSLIFIIRLYSRSPSFRSELPTDSRSVIGTCVVLILFTIVWLSDRLSVSDITVYKYVVIVFKLL